MGVQVCLCVCLSGSVSGWMDGQTHDGLNIQGGEEDLLLLAHRSASTDPISFIT